MVAVDCIVQVLLLRCATVPECDNGPFYCNVCLNVFEERVWCCGKNINIHKSVMRRRQHFSEGRRKKEKKKKKRYLCHINIKLIVWSSLSRYSTSSQDAYSVKLQYQTVMCRKCSLGQEM